MEVTRSIGQDLRSDGKADYVIPREFTFFKFETDRLRDSCFEKLYNLMEVDSDESVEEFKQDLPR